MTKPGKRLRQARANFDRETAYPIGEAVALLKKGGAAKFDETIEIAMNLGVDPRHADQMVRGVCQLPNGSGRSVRVAVCFLTPWRARQAKHAAEQALFRAAFEQHLAFYVC